MQNKKSIQDQKEEKDRLVKKIIDLPDFRQGTLYANYRKCGKMNCHCATDDSKGHGPSWSVTRKHKNKSVIKVVSQEDCEVTQQQIDVYHQFQGIINEYVEVNIKICDARLEGGKTASRGAEKRAELKNQKCHAARDLRIGNPGLGRFL